MTEQTTHRPSWRDAQREAALAEMQAQSAERAKVHDLLISARDHGRRLGDLIKIGEDYVAQVIDDRSGGFGTTWATIVAGKDDSYRYRDVEHALLHLVARRYVSGHSDAAGAAFYAGRVLGMPDPAA